MPEAEKRFQSYGLAAVLVASLPPDVKKLRLWLDPLQNQPPLSMAKFDAPLVAN